MYTVMHVGYPVAGRAIRADEWKKYSEHATESAAWKAVKKATAHLESGQWDDHYIVLDPNGERCDRELFWARSEAASLMGRRGGSKTSPAKKLSSAANGRKGGRPRKQ